MNFASRSVRIQTKASPLRCPVGHKLKDPIVWNEGGLRCNHKSPRTGWDDCGRLVLVIGGPFSYKGKPMSLIIEVSGHEMQEMKRKRMTIDEMLAYLDVDLDSSEAA